MVKLSLNKSQFATKWTTLFSFLGDCVKPNVIESLSDGVAKKVAEGLMMAHLISTLPIVLNAPNQYIEGLLGLEHSA